MDFFVQIKNRNTLELNINNQTFKLQTEYHLSRITKAIQNEKRIILIVLEYNSLNLVFVFNLKNNFFKQILFLENLNAPKNFKQLKIDLNGQRLEQEKFLFKQTKSENLYNFEIKVKNHNIISLKVTYRDKYSKFFLLKCKTNNTSFERKEFSNYVFYTGYDNIYCVCIILEQNYVNAFLVNTKPNNIGITSMFLYAKNKRYSELVEFIINNAVCKKKTFLKNKMIFEVINNE